MKITFLLPFTEMSGGVKAVFEFANHLKKRGHYVCIAYPMVPLYYSGPIKWLSVIKGSIKNFFKGKARVDWFNLEADLIRVPLLSEKYIPDADAVIATLWATAYSASRLSIKKGQKFYLIQHYEIWGGPKNEVDGSYKLGLKAIVNSTWLKNLLWEKFKVKPEALILHAPDRDQFYQDSGIIKDKNKIRILIPYRSEKWKGVEDGVKAFEVAREKHENLQLVMFGPIYGKEIPKYAEFHKKPNNDELRRIYNSCHIFVFPSRSEGFGMPPMEAMACGIAVACTNVGAVLDYAIAGQTALVSEPEDVHGLAENIIKLVEDENKRKKIAENGKNYTSQITWKNASEQLEKVFKNIKSKNE